MFQKPKRNFISSYYKSQIVPSVFQLSFGTIGFISLSTAFLDKRQMESIRLLVTRIIRRRRVVTTYVSGEVKSSRKRGWMKFHALYNISITKKGSKSRMGKGKGAIDQYVYAVKQNQCFLELRDVPIITALNILKKIRHKLGIRVAIISNEKRMYHVL